MFIISKKDNINCQINGTKSAGPRSAVGRASDAKARGVGFDTRSGHIFSFRLSPIQTG